MNNYVLLSKLGKTGRKLGIWFYLIAHNFKIDFKIATYYFIGCNFKIATYHIILKFQPIILRKIG